MIILTKLNTRILTYIKRIWLWDNRGILSGVKEVLYYLKDKGYKLYVKCITSI